MRKRMSPKAMLDNLQGQLEQLPHLAQMTRAALEGMARPAHGAPPPRDRHILRLLGAALLAGGVLLASRAPLNTADAWPGWLMLASGLYLLVRRQRFPD